MFSLLHTVAETLHPNLQILLMDHAHLDLPWFQEDIVEEWRDGVKLIPADW